MGMDTRARAVTVYRIQPQGAKLHGIETRDSNDALCGGVHVFESLGEVYTCFEWRDEPKVELVTIACQPEDVRPNGDCQGALLLRGRGRIVTRRKFRSVRAVADWVKTQV